MTAIKSYQALQVNNHQRKQVTDLITVEEMLGISVNGEPYTITMRTPGDEEALTRGILLTENVYANHVHNPVFDIVERNEEGVITKVNVQIPQDELLAGIHEKRNLLSVSSCGMCGKYDVDVSLHGVLKPTAKLNLLLVPKLFDTMAKHQQLFTKSGGCHAAALFTIEGQFLDCKEDIGRHNAVDKTIGQVLLHHQLSLAEILLVSGRVSYEIVSKAHKAGIPYLCSVSAPSSMAIDYCRQSGITLLAFCRGDKFTVYAGE
ncbi:MAG: formate dehydrogenase accessory sulfurtransferase FdhD [Bacteroidetes bacterium]|nr:formate dehydrogenase accessory sulfurtransferase FdhD [Bacteroidota bacterium]